MDVSEQRHAPASLARFKQPPRTWSDTERIGEPKDSTAEPHIESRRLRS
jgi:hypothetical protein